MDPRAYIQALRVSLSRSPPFLVHTFILALHDRCVGKLNVHGPIFTPYFYLSVRFLCPSYFPISSLSLVFAGARALFFPFVRTPRTFFALRSRAPGGFFGSHPSCAHPSTYLNSFFNPSTPRSHENFQLSNRFTLFHRVPDSALLILADDVSYALAMQIHARSLISHHDLLHGCDNENQYYKQL